MTTADVVGLLAAGITLISEIIYIRSIVVLSKNRTQPSRSTFWIWTVIQGVFAATYIATGETFAAGISLVYAVCFFLIALLSIRYGYSRWERIDTQCAVAVVVAITVWITTKDPVLALFASIIADALGAFPTLKKVWHEPRTESRSAWTLAVIAAVINIGAVQAWGIADVAFNGYLIAINGLITWRIWLPNRVV